MYPLYSLDSVIKYAIQLFHRHNVDEPKASAIYLLMDILDVSHSEIQMNLTMELTESQWIRYQDYLLRRCLHEPVQYITGTVSFMGMNFCVHSSVLIPRPETEEMVHLILSLWRKKREIHVWDIGTGSGCIGLSLKKQCPSWRVTCWDNNPAAVYLAMINAQKLKVNPFFLCEDFQKMSLKEIHLLVKKKVHIIVSNPPYVLFEKWCNLSFQVSYYEPMSALICYDIPLLLKSLENLASHCLYSNGWLVLEIDAELIPSIFQIFDYKKWCIQIIPDYLSKPRFMFAQLSTLT